MESKRLANYIEKLRYGRKISQEEFCHGITSLRQYQRYRSGKCELPLDVIDKMSRKLGIPTKKLYLEFGKEEIIETKRVTKYYNLVVTREFEKAKTFRNMNNFEIFIDDEKEKFYVSASLLMSYLENDLSIVDFVRKQSKLIDYPQVIKKTILTDSETLILGIIMENSPIDRDIIMEKLLVIIENDDLHITGRNIFAKCQVIFWLTKNYGKQKKHDKVIQLCNKGIMLNKDNYTYYLLEYFYYYKALSCLRTNLFIEFEDNLYNALRF